MKEGAFKTNARYVSDGVSFDMVGNPGSLLLTASEGHKVPALWIGIRRQGRSDEAPVEPPGAPWTQT